MASSTENSPYQYPKRPGTSGIRGQLYETKLLSLIYFRAIHNVNIEDFHLATNVDKIGSFDDICFKAKFKGNNKPIAVFLQAKHKENNNSVLSLNRDDLVDYFNSYLKIRLKFETYNTDVLFNGGINETDCRFVIYTNAKGDKTNETYEGSLADDLNALMRTGDPGSRPSYDKKDEKILYKICKIVLEEQMTALAQQMVKCMQGEFRDIQRLMENELVLLYHVLLGQQVFDISEIQPEGYRDANIKERIFVDISRRGVPFGRTPRRRDAFYQLQLYMFKSMSESQLRQKFKVPASFGNKDLTIKGNDKKIERELNYLTSNIIKLIEKSKPNKIVIIDESMGTGFLQLNGGIASAVGNLLILDESCNLMKINDNYESLGNLSKTLYRKLKNEIDDLNEYKFDVKVKTFPKLSYFAIGEYRKGVVSDFLSTLLFYTSQQSEDKVEETLISEITSCQGDDVQHVEVTSDAIFFKYHDQVQKWSMKSKMGTYLDKEGSLYKNAVDHAARQSLTSVINMMYKIKNKNYTQGMIFREEAANTIKFESLLSGTVIVTENSELTVAKLISHLTNTVVLDFEYILNLSERDHRALREELMNTKEVKKLIVVFINAQSINTSSSRKLENIANSMKDFKVIIVTDQDSVANAKKYFSPTGIVIEDEIKLIDFSEESQKCILKDTNVIFQGDEVCLDEIWVSDMMEYVEGAVLIKMMHDKRCVIGKPISNPNYKPELYIERAVTCIRKGNERLVPIFFKKLISSEFDTLIIGDPGMGKSTLLTHLSLEAKKCNCDWMLRINLLEYSKQFSEWKVKKTDIDRWESLKFLCKVALSEESSKTNDLNITLEESASGDVRLKDCTGDEWTVFELKMFLNFHNRKSKVKILFDGFDEICPTYENEVLSLIKAIQQYHRRHSIWITSRSNDNMKGFEFDRFGKVKLYKLKPLNYEEQNYYLKLFWEEKAILKDLNNDQRQNVYDFIIFMSQSEELLKYKAKSYLPKESINIKPFAEVFVSFIKYIDENLVSAPPFVKYALRKLNHKCYSFRCDNNDSFAIPIHLNIIAEYLCNKIKEVNIKPHNWDWDTNIFNIYEDLMVTKMKRIRFQEKTQNDMSKPDNISAYEREYADFKDKHKKLAAYTFYDKCLFDKDEIAQIEEMIYDLKEGEERTGVICKVVNDVPIFVHSTFAEYFAVDYICDLLKREEHQESLRGIILNEMFFNCNNNLLATLDAKLKIDEELSALLIRNKSIIFDLLLKQAENTQKEHGEIKSSLCEVIRMDLRNIRHLLLSIIADNLNKHNLMDFINLVNGTNMFVLAVKMELEEFVIRIVNRVEAIDKSKLIPLFKDFVHNENIANLSSDELVQKIQTYMWMRMGIKPDWKNLEDLVGHITFI